MDEKQIESPEPQEDSNLFLKILGYSVVLIGTFKKNIFKHKLDSHWFDLLFAIVFFLTTCGIIYNLAQKIHKRRKKDVEPMREIEQQASQKFDWGIVGSVCYAIFCFVLAIASLMRYLKIIS